MFLPPPLPPDEGVHSSGCNRSSGVVMVSMMMPAAGTGGQLRRTVVLGLLAFATACYVMPNITPLYNATIAVWNKERGDLACYYAVWVALDTSVVLAAVVSAGDVTPVISPAARTVTQPSRYRSSRLRCLARLGVESGWLRAPFALAVVLSMYAWLELGVHQQGQRYDWGRGFVPAEHHGRQFWQQWMQKSALYAGVASLVPLTLLGLPLGRSAAMWRVAGLAYEEAVALHRGLGHLTMALLTLHAVGYLAPTLGLKAPPWQRPALGAPQLTHLAAWGGHSRLLSALRTRDAPLSYSEAQHGRLAARPCGPAEAADAAASNTTLRWRGRPSRSRRCWTS